MLLQRLRNQGQLDFAIDRRDPFQQVMNKHSVFPLLLVLSTSVAGSAALAFDDSPAFAEPRKSGSESRQRALPEHFSAVSSPAWVDEIRGAPDSTKELILASQAGKLDQVKALLAAGALPNGADEFGQRPLLVAVAEGQTEITRLLLRRGASPNVKGQQGRTPLSMAAAAGNLNIVRSLLRAGAEVDARSDNRATALHEAVRFDHPDIVRTLLAAGPNPEHYDREGLHPLALAAAKGRLACLKNFLDAGVSPDLPDKTGLTALYWARRYDQALAESILVEHGASREAWPIFEN